MMNNINTINSPKASFYYALLKKNYELLQSGSFQHSSIFFLYYAVSDSPLKYCPRKTAETINEKKISLQYARLIQAQQNIKT